MKNLLVIGNSHAHFFSFTHPGHFGWSPRTLIESDYNLRINTCSIGPTTAFRFATKHYPYFLAQLYQRKPEPGTLVLIPVGEVDCRLHLPQQAHKQNRSISEVVEECVDRFFKVLLSLKSLGFRPIAWGGAP